MPPADVLGSARPPTLPHGDPVAVELTGVVHAGDLDALRRLIADRPELASVRMIGRKAPDGGWRTSLHAAADWPGYFPAAPATVVLLLAAGPTRMTTAAVIARRRRCTGRRAPMTSKSRSH
jgi:hypothetical protein